MEYVRHSWPVDGFDPGFRGSLSGMVVIQSLLVCAQVYAPPAQAEADGRCSTHL